MREFSYMPTVNDTAMCTDEFQKCKSTRAVFHDTMKDVFFSDTDTVPGFPAGTESFVHRIGSTADERKKNAGFLGIYYGTIATSASEWFPHVKKMSKLHSEAEICKYILKVAAKDIEKAKQSVTSERYIPS